jgi:hypothetical protein
MAKKKGAFQMSLGFIVAVVFAVVLLTLTVTWVQQLFGQIGTLTDDLTQDAHSTLQKQFKDSSKNFAVWPSRRIQKPGTGVILSAAVENDADDGQSHKFVVNVVPAAASSSVCPGGELGECSSPVTGKFLDEYMQEWVTWPTSQQSVIINGIGFWDIGLNVPDDAIKGQYMFNVIACWDYDSSGNPVTPTHLLCDQIADNIWGGSAQPLTVTVE